MQIEGDCPSNPFFRSIIDFQYFVFPAVQFYLCFSVWRKNFKVRNFSEKKFSLFWPKMQKILIGWFQNRKTKKRGKFFTQKNQWSIFCPRNLFFSTPTFRKLVFYPLQTPRNISSLSRTIQIHIWCTFPFWLSVVTYSSHKNIFSKLKIHS